MTKPLDSTTYVKNIYRNQKARENQIYRYLS